MTTTKDSQGKLYPTLSESTNKKKRMDQFFLVLAILLIPTGGLDWIGLILFRLGHPLSHWLLFRGPSNQKYTINKQQTNKHTTLLIVMISDKCSIMQCSVLLVAVVGILHSSLLVVAGGVQRKKARNTITGIGPQSIP